MSSSSVATAPTRVRALLLLLCAALCGGQRSVISLVILRWPTKKSGSDAARVYYPLRQPRRWGIGAARSADTRRHYNCARHTGVMLAHSNDVYEQVGVCLWSLSGNRLEKRCGARSTRETDRKAGEDLSRIDCGRWCSLQSRGQPVTRTLGWRNRGKAEIIGDRRTAKRREGKRGDLP